MPEDMELYRTVGRMESKLDAILARVEHLEKKMEEISTQKQTAQGVFLAAKSAWIAGAAIIGAFSDNIINWFLHK